jgi:hypothetical protein
MIDGLFRVYNAPTAIDFLNALRLTNSTLWGGEPFKTVWRHRWLFRGQSDISLPLLPSIWRSDEHSLIFRLLETFKRKQKPEKDREFASLILSRGKRFEGYPVQDEWIDNALHIYYRTQVEVALIDRLFDQALQRGIAIPDYSRIRAFLNLFIRNPLQIIHLLADADFDALDQEFLKAIHNNSFFALAQHHGIPTRLLDWSTGSYIAAFFAAEGALSKKMRTNY